MQNHGFSLIHLLAILALAAIIAFLLSHSQQEGQTHDLDSRTVSTSAVVDESVDPILVSETVDPVEVLAERTAVTQSADPSLVVANVLVSSQYHEALANSVRSMERFTSTIKALAEANQVADEEVSQGP